MKTIEQQIEEKAPRDPGFAIAYALLLLAQAQERTASAVRALGNGDAATSMGAIEALGMHLGEKLDSLDNAARDISKAIWGEV